MIIMTLMIISNPLQTKASFGVQVSDSIIGSLIRCQDSLRFVPMDL